MKPGVYRVVFSGFGEAAAGVAIVRGAQLVGGDSNFYYTGRLRQEGDRLFAQIEAVRHSAGPASAFGPLSHVTLEVAGSVTDEGAKLTGSAKQMPAVSAAVTFSPIAPFEGMEALPRSEPRTTRVAEAPANSRRGADCPFADDDEDRRAEAPCTRVGWLDKPMSDLQLRLLAALWSLGEAPAVELHQALAPARKVALSTIGHALADMERRRLISHRSLGSRHIYRAEVMADQVMRSLAKSLAAVADTIYQGDRVSFIQQLMQAPDMGGRELEPPPAPEPVRQVPRSRASSTEPRFRTRSQ